MTRNIDLPPLTRAADLLPASIDAAERTIDVVWSTGARACAALPSSAIRSTRNWQWIPAPSVSIA
jgi:hypothetical protein